MCVIMAKKTILFVSRLKACLDTLSMRTASIMRFGNVKERRKRILAILEPKSRVYCGVVHRLEGPRPPYPTDAPLSL